MKHIVKCSKFVNLNKHEQIPDSYRTVVTPEANYSILLAFEASFSRFVVSEVSYLILEASEVRFSRVMTSEASYHN